MRPDDSKLAQLLDGLPLNADAAKRAVNVLLAQIDEQMIYKTVSFLRAADHVATGAPREETVEGVLAVEVWQNDYDAAEQNVWLLTDKESRTAFRVTDVRIRS